jgi:hypothetical protein
MKKQDKKLQKDENLSQEDIESMELLQRASEKVGRQLTINSDSGELQEIDELKQLISKDFENPEEKYAIYYKGIRKLLMDYLPKGKEYKEMRDIIYDEKNIFLSQGKRKSDNNGIRKGDGRMTFQPVMNEILDVVVSWVGSSQNPLSLYKDFYELNEKFEYGHEEYDKSTESVAKAMLNLSKNE